MLTARRQASTSRKPANCRRPGCYSSLVGGTSASAQDGDPPTPTGFAIDETSPFHARARDWLAAVINGATRVGLPWQSLVAFVRIATNPRVSDNPLDPERAWRIVNAWLGADSTWIPLPGDRHAAVLGDLVQRYRPTGNLVSDAHLAALAIEHGLRVVSADGDFARFTEVRWENPLRPN